MARAQASDPLHNFRFHVTAIANDADGITAGVLQPADGGGLDGSGQAGFQAVGTPEYDIEKVDYREGTMTYTQIYPGIPSTNVLTFARGVARRDTAFFDWVKGCAEGRGYRCDLVIWHFTREGRSYPFNPSTDLAPNRAKRYVLFNAFGNHVKAAPDLESGANEVSLTEMHVVFERWDNLPVAA